MEGIIISDRRRKIKLEIESAARIKQLGLHPLDVLDDMFHAMFVLRKTKLQAEHPNATDEDILRIMQDESTQAKKYNLRRRRPIYD
jgi:hypothetical protein